MITHKELVDLFHYDPLTGEFIRKVTRGPMKAGTVAGSLTFEGYVAIKINGHSYQAHRLAWLYMTGALPADLVDHIDNDRGNNSWANLRAADRCLNAQNTHARKSGKIVGASFNKPTGRWHSRINVRGKLVSLGYFQTKEQAQAAYLAAASEHHAIVTCEVA